AVQSDDRDVVTGELGVGVAEEGQTTFDLAEGGCRLGDVAQFDGAGEQARRLEHERQRNNHLGEGEVPAHQGDGPSNVAAIVGDDGTESSVELPALGAFAAVEGDSLRAIAQPD